MSNAGPPAGSTAAGPRRHLTDHEQLLLALNILGGVPVTSLNASNAGYRPHPIVLSLQDAGITTWTSLVTMRDDDINLLQFDAAHMDNSLPANSYVSLTIGHRSILRAMIAFYQHKSRQLKYSVLPQKIEPTEFQQWRTSDWNPNFTPVPWNTAPPASHATIHDKQISDWLKVTKPNANDYPVLNENTNYQKWIEKTKAVAIVHRLEHTLDPNHVPENPVLYAAQKQWMYMALSKAVKHPTGRNFINEHTVDMDSSVCFDKIHLWLKSSVTNLMESGRKSAWLTQTRITFWTGTQVEYITKWKETRREYNSLCVPGSDFNDLLSVQLLNASVAGAPNLANVYTTQVAARRSVGRTSHLTYDEFVGELLEAAELFDNTDGGGINKPNKLQNKLHMLSANLNDTVIYDGEYDHVLQEDPQDSHDLEANIHNMDTSVSELLAFQNNMVQRKPFRGRNDRRNTNRGNKPKVVRVFMDKEKYQSLSDKAKEIWNSLPEEDKAKILQKSLSGDRRSGNPSRRRANNHELTHDDDEDSKDDHDDDKENDVTIEYEVGNHDLVKTPPAELKSTPLSHASKTGGSSDSNLALTNLAQTEEGGLLQVLRDGKGDKETVDGHICALLSQRNDRDIKSYNASSTRDHRHHPLVRSETTPYEVNVNRQQAHKSGPEDAKDTVDIDAFMAALGNTNALVPVAQPQQQQPQQQRTVTIQQQGNQRVHQENRSVTRTRSQTFVHPDGQTDNVTQSITLNETRTAIIPNQGPFGYSRRNVAQIPSQEPTPAVIALGDIAIPPTEPYSQGNIQPMQPGIYRPTTATTSPFGAPVPASSRFSATTPYYSGAALLRAGLYTTLPETTTQEPDQQATTQQEQDQDRENALVASWVQHFDQLNTNNSSSSDSATSQQRQTDLHSRFATVATIDEGNAATNAPDPNSTAIVPYGSTTNDPTAPATMYGGKSNIPKPTNRIMEGTNPLQTKTLQSKGPTDLDPLIYDAIRGRLGRNDQDSTSDRQGSDSGSGDDGDVQDEHMPSYEEQLQNALIEQGQVDPNTGGVNPSVINAILEQEDKANQQAAAAASKATKQTPKTIVRQDVDSNQSDDGNDDDDDDCDAKPAATSQTGSDSSDNSNRSSSQRIRGVLRDRETQFELTVGETQLSRSTSDPDLTATDYCSQITDAVFTPLHRLLSPFSIGTARSTGPRQRSDRQVTIDRSVFETPDITTDLNANAPVYHPHSAPSGTSVVPPTDTLSNPLDPSSNTGVPRQRRYKPWTETIAQSPATAPPKPKAVKSKNSDDDKSNTSKGSQGSQDTPRRSGRRRARGRKSNKNKGPRDGVAGLPKDLQPKLTPNPWGGHLVPPSSSAIKGPRTTRHGLQVPPSTQPRPQPRQRQDHGKPRSNTNKGGKNNGNPRQDNRKKTPDNRKKPPGNPKDPDSYDQDFPKGGLA